ncbi:MAG: hypothetical protein HOV66_15395 [Streptomycetaceae bacterium]|nr:hypothetical protein [Streptomycetaceae bacterium]
MTAIVFLDTETTGLDLTDDIWEIAAIRREPDGSERELHLFLEHDPFKCARLPESFRLDHERRFPPMGHNGKWSADVVAQYKAASLVSDFLDGRPHVVGAVPNFDTERIARLCARNLEDWRAPWHYHLIDVENLAVGYLAAKGVEIDLPWNSDTLSGALGITAPEDERHTAMGDVRWAMRIYDAVMGGTK